ncbi:cyclopropane-fatty-acyl-phospholipid synthase [Chitinophaga terrae (ex Kim and Jung 2007)]|uniref:Cyclopropane-fatty-acyl-phospholipid synthase n=1 Tax=Chitinophaga terrae (ex Kim and Jung 2007) TaxID=408074 RepID=A0A1H3ZGK3_9BACT|nr:cyclopropane fatty acyl phospholipid synthase [Chitinophaga terrae (ex Kim and Jung 2007)]GEP88726.1 cyclopropane-fatty-acyl-phospholipid synthase [Chitinophaga terrae (ex Kim and Jung 2007)]SEA22434.1 cyclopropane-fatty-acyl-phospholipid synthase [Chitinophaga terrae (ex Kim and Jung 2007)]
MNAKSIVTRLLDAAGITPDGSAPYDIHINNEQFYTEALHKGSLGLGESYMKGYWDSEALDEFFARILSARLDEKIKRDLGFRMQILLARLFNFQRPNKAVENGSRHYDLGNDLFELMLDKRLTYTCAFWEGARNLDEAQENKLDLTCRKLNLRPGMHVLDIGCGWGSFAQFAASKYGVKVTGVTISKEQVALAKEKCKGLPVDIRLTDYRALDEKFDAIVSLGMFEHVGYKNYRTYMEVAHRCLKDNGLFLLHTIGGNVANAFTDRWLNKYIFPNAMIPTMGLIGQSFEDLFVMEHWQNFGVDYDRTLLAWYENVQRNWDRLKSKYDQRFFRMWKYYLLSCAGSFRARTSQLWQMVLSKEGVPGGYKFKNRATVPGYATVTGNVV